MGTGAAFVNGDHSILEAICPSSNFDSLWIGKQSSASAITSADIVKSLRDSVGLGVSDLAKICGVSRQAVYNWMDGDAISSDQLKTVQALGWVLTEMRENGFATDAMSFRKKLVDGHTFVEMIVAGYSIEEAAAALESVIRVELEQRTTLAERLARAKPGRATPDAEFMPSFDERT
jgi:predicted transcriptional regulator